MGWWSQDTQGNSFGEGGGSWGDGPADILGNALDSIVKEFERAFGRKPTCGEIRRGLEFSLGHEADEVEYPWR